MTITPIDLQKINQKIGNLNKIVNLTIPCQGWVVLPASHIFATDLYITPTTCTEPCTLTITVTYKNDGGISGKFTPTITIDGIPTALPDVILDPGIISQTFSITNIKQGSHIICAQPSGLPGIPCQTISVKPSVATAGIPLILGAGLFIGFIMQKRKEECSNYKTKVECQKNECQWKNKKKECVPLSEEDKYLIKKLREKGAVGIPDCSGEQCRIGKWVAIARPKGQEPIIIHDP